MHDAAGLRALISEYGQLRAAEGARQTRGQRFNGLIAEMLRCWGIEAEASTLSPGRGEIDVTFTLNGERYLVEAKWEHEKTNADPLFKLQARLKQRLRGPIGIFVSMAGFTADALRGLDSGSQLEVLLFDRSHLEAMLSGLVPPQELIGLAHDRAAFRGDAYSPLTQLLASRSAEPPVSFDPPAPSSAPSELSLATKPLVTLANSNQLGIAYGSSDEILVTHADGIAGVDAVKRRARWRVPLRDCHRNALQADDGSVLVVRRNAVARFKDGDLSIVGGGFSDNSCLLQAVDSAVWVLDGDTGLSGPPSITITRLGTQLGEEERNPLSTRWDSSARAAVWMDENRLAVVHSSSFSVIQNLDHQTLRGLHTGTSNGAAILRIDDDHVLIAGGDGYLELTDVNTGRHAAVARLGLAPSAVELVSNSANKMLAASYVGDGSMDIVVVDVEFVPSIAAVADEAFKAADSGQVAEYFEQYNRIPQVDVPQPTAAEPDHNTLYNKVVEAAWAIVSPLDQIATNAGLAPTPYKPQGTMDGWPPPSYSGSAAVPRWRAPGVVDGPLIEAIIGVGARRWPTENFNDLVITLLVARRTETGQHMLMTRFVPCLLEDPSLQQKIESVIYDLETILPTAFEDFYRSSAHPEDK
ncbi:restriction endonuclease [Kribbella sp. NPDC051587]|uniref:restriction endonuclease n=1 Tax=Kribbella sp. NPDC051587 TaxID=3364119 RepID=UPI0037A517B0